MHLPVFSHHARLDLVDLRGTMGMRLFVVDPVEVLYEGIRSWLSAGAEFEVVGHASNGTRFMERLSAVSCDLVLMEVSMPEMDGIDTMRALHRLRPEVKVLAHSELTGVEYVNSMLIEGACGYLVKGCTREELLVALRTVRDGERYLSLPARISVERGYSYTEKRPDGEYIGLTQREREIIRLVALERTNGEIAAALHISEDTVKTHRKNLMTKLNVRSIAGLVKYAIDRRWI